MKNYCKCRRCRRARRRGLVLGSKWAHYYVFGGLMKVSAYVPNPRWRPGRRPTPPVPTIGDY